MTRRELRQADYLSHMLDAISLAQSYVEGISKTDFLHDKRTQQAVILNIMVIGEARHQAGRRISGIRFRISASTMEKYARNA